MNAHTQMEESSILGERAITILSRPNSELMGHFGFCLYSQLPG
jgi:hypothetical protein